MTIAGIKRANKYSPNHVSNDSIIFDLVVDKLKELYDVQIFNDQENFFYDESKHDAIITMTRSLTALKQLQKIEKEEHIPVINSAFGIENCFRSNITKIFLENNIPTPVSEIVSTQKFDITEIDKFQSNGFWIKRGDFHAIEKEDVSFAETKREVCSILNSFEKRNIPEAVVSENIKGDLVKFYGVLGTSFFYSLYPYEINHYKYQEFQVINGATQFFNYDKHTLKEVAEKIATVAHVPIYGGDAVIDRDGHIFIIDFNDWPSFAPCRDEAAANISQYIKNQIHDR